MAEEYTESDISKEVRRLMDEEGYEFGEAVKEAMSKGYKDGGLMVAIQKFNQGGPIRKNYQTGGISVGGSTPLATYQRQGYKPYDSRATAQDYANALQSVSAGTTYQQQADAKRYARQQANQMLTDAFRSGNQETIKNLYNHLLFHK